MVIPIRLPVLICIVLILVATTSPISIKALFEPRKRLST